MPLDLEHRELGRRVFRLNPLWLAGPCGGPFDPLVMRTFVQQYLLKIAVDSNNCAVDGLRAAVRTLNDDSNQVSHFAVR